MPVDHSPIIINSGSQYFVLMYLNACIINVNAFSCAEDMYGAHCTCIVCPNGIYFLVCEAIWCGLDECISIRKQVRIVSQSHIVTKMAGKEVKN